MAVRIQFRRGTAAEWTSANPTLAPGELGYETDTTKFKLGDGSTSWTSLGYGGVNQADIDAAVANVIDLSPSTLDTLNELAASIGDDADFAGTVASNIATAESNALAYSNSIANSVTTNVNSYTDNAIADLVASAPGTLDTLNELASALGDDPNFATTVTSSLGTKISFVADSESNFDSSNPDPILANTLYVTTDTRRLKVGDGIGDWANAVFVGEDFTDLHASSTESVHGISNTLNLVYQQDLTVVANNLQNVSDAVDTVESTSNTLSTSLDALSGRTTTLETTANTLTTSVETLDTRANTVDTSLASLETTANTLTTETDSLSDRADALENTTGTLTTSVESLDTRATSLESTANTLTSSTSNLDNRVGTLETTVVDLAPLSGAELGTPTITAAAFEGATTLAVDATLGGITPTELGYLSGVTSGIQAQVDTKAPSADPSFTGNVVLPSTTEIGSVSGVEIAYLDNVSANIQSQLDAKIATSSAASIYAPIASPTLTGTVGLPADTSIGDVSATEIGYLNNVSSAIQTQLNAKLASATASSTYAPIDSPTFTTAATLPAQTTIGSVSATEIGYLDGVTSAIQTQIDAKAALAGPTFTGTVEAVDLTLTGNLYVQGSTTTISTTNLKLRDNMTYLNQAGVFDVADAVGDGTNVVYTTTATHDLSVGDYLTVESVTPSSFDIGAGAGVEVLAVTDTTLTVASSVTDTYASGGTARGKIHANPDLGWAAGRYAANTYAHAGFFRDATDGVFKVFDGYVPEPDESAFIDTSDNTFALAGFAASTVTAANVVATTGVTFADSTVQTSAGVPSLTDFTEKTASYTLDTLDHQDNVVEVNSASATTFTIPTNAALAWPVGASMDILQIGAGQVTISPDSGVTLNYTPGNKLRTQWSSCTIMKRGTDSWIVFGDLTA